MDAPLYFCRAVRVDCPASLYLMALAKEQIKLAFEQSEKEVADLHQRTREGLLTARLNGKQVGRKRVLDLKRKKPEKPSRLSVPIARPSAAHWMTWSA